jgi:acetyl-CoA carboxylase carboxyl transferase subunit alpha
MLRERADSLLADTYARLSPWERTLVARHPQRPYTHDYIAGMFSDFHELAGDRSYADDPAIVCFASVRNSEAV